MSTSTGEIPYPFMFWSLEKVPLLYRCEPPHIGHYRKYTPLPKPNPPPSPTRLSVNTAAQNNDNTKTCCFFYTTTNLQLNKRWQSFLAWTVKWWILQKLQKWIGVSPKKLKHCPLLEQLDFVYVSFNIQSQQAPPMLFPIVSVFQPQCHSLQRKTTEKCSYSKLVN